MNLLWGGMLAAGIFYGALTGNLDVVTQAVLDSARSAVSLAITMAGIMAFWTGIMQIGQSSGVIDAAVRMTDPALDWLFPYIPKGHPARESIAVNCISNVFGLGWAATPAGLKAMEELERLENERRRQQSQGKERRFSGLPVRERRTAGAAAVGTASNEMCTFLVLNISSLQLIPVNIIAYRSQYGSANPAGIVGPAIVATCVSTAVAVVFCKVMGRHGHL